MNRHQVKFNMHSFENWQILYCLKNQLKDFNINIISKSVFAHMLVLKFLEKPSHQTMMRFTIMTLK